MIFFCNLMIISWIYMSALATYMPLMLFLHICIDVIDFIILMLFLNISYIYAFDVSSLGTILKYFI